jgi:hypothetical protein
MAQRAQKLFNRELHETRKNHFSHDLNRLGSDERNLARPKVRQDRVSGRERVHCTNGHRFISAFYFGFVCPSVVELRFSDFKFPLSANNPHFSFLNFSFQLF